MGVGLALTLGASGCSTVGYLLQAGRGQLAILNRARPIDEVLRDERTPPRVRRLLSEIPRIKAYGEQSGHLRPTRNYTEFVQLDRPAASWVVSACRPLEFASKHWSFPIVGSFPYLGWFDLARARAYGDELKAEGWDVNVRGASAFSTLGWFHDPILSSMIPEGEDTFGDLVNVVLHESVHATLYVNGQSSFNESLASFVADQMTPAYLQARLGLDSPEYRAYVRSSARDALWERELHATYLELAELYRSARPDAEKLARKQAILTALAKRLETKREFNNATLVQYRTYATGRPELTALLKGCGGDWARFFAALRTLGAREFGSEQREDFGPVIAPLAAQCGGGGGGGSESPGDHAS